MRTLIVLVILIAAAWIVYNYLRARREHRLRHGQRARRAVIEVMLPRDMGDANKRMTRFWHMVASLTIPDGPERKQGEGQIDAIMLGYRTPGRVAPTLKFLIECDTKNMDRVKRAINTCFDGIAAILDVRTHPLRPVEEMLLAAEEKEGHGFHQVVEVDP